MKPYAVTFAGVQGSSKTIISNYLSWKFGLPIFNNDQLRAEVKEDLMVDNINIPEALAEFEKRMTGRRLEIFATRRPIIFDGSVDRRWEESKKQFLDADYDWFLVSLNLSKEFLVKLFNSTGRAKFAQTKLDGYLKQHEEFVDKYDSDVSVRITDETFKDRLKVSADGLQSFLDKRA
jgi:hypothetical protein